MESAPVSRLRARATRASAAPEAAASAAAAAAAAVVGLAAGEAADGSLAPGLAVATCHAAFSLLSPVLSPVLLPGAPVVSGASAACLLLGPPLLRPVASPLALLLNQRAPMVVEHGSDLCWWWGVAAHAAAAPAAAATPCGGRSALTAAASCARSGWGARRNLWRLMMLVFEQIYAFIGVGCGLGAKVAGRNSWLFF